MCVHFLALTLALALALALVHTEIFNPADAKSQKSRSLNAKYKLKNIKKNPKDWNRHRVAPAARQPSLTREQTKVKKERNLNVKTKPKRWHSYTHWQRIHPHDVTITCSELQSVRVLMEKVGNCVVT